MFTFCLVRCDIFLFRFMTALGHLFWREFSFQSELVEVQKCCEIGCKWSIASLEFEPLESDLQQHSLWILLHSSVPYLGISQLTWLFNITGTEARKPWLRSFDACNWIFHLEQFNFGLKNWEVFLETFWEVWHKRLIDGQISYLGFILTLFFWHNIANWWVNYHLNQWLILACAKIKQDKLIFTRKKLFEFLDVAHWRFFKCQLPKPAYNYLNFGQPFVIYQ